MAPNSITTAVGRADGPARLQAIRRYLAAFLHGERLTQIWEEGFATPRQPSFRINTLRAGDLPASTSPQPTPADTDAYAHPSAGFHPSSGQEDIVRQLLEGFGLSGETEVEVVPYFPGARVLPAHTAAAVRVAPRIHSLAPLRMGAVYFMSLSSMLPALALMALQPIQPQTALRLPSTAGTKAASGRPSSSLMSATAASAAVGGSCCGGGMVGGSSGGSGGDGDGSGGLRVLDLCAAPGGKTALLAELMGNRGTLLAVDSSWPRLQRLQFNLERLLPEHPNQPQPQHDALHHHRQQPSNGEENWEARSGPSPQATWRRGCVVAVHADGRSLRVDEHGLPLNATAAVRRRRGRGHGAHYEAVAAAGAGASADGWRDDEGWTGVYDRILVDAPCSSLGRLQLHRPDTYSDWEPVHARRNAVRQRDLLLRATRLLRRGGSLVYSTCTIDPQENEAVVAWLLSRVPGLRLVEPRLPAGLVPQPTLSSLACNPCDPIAAAPATTADATAGSLQQPPGVDTGRGLGRDNAHPALAHNTMQADSRGSSSAPAVSVIGGYSDGCYYGWLDGCDEPVPTTSLRQALEAHRPGCTYPALVEGLSGECVSAAAADGAAYARAPFTANLGTAAMRGHQRLAPHVGGVSGAVGNGGAAAAAALLREQLAACCVRVAPGGAYEGFFLAQLVKL